MKLFVILRMASNDLIHVNNNDVPSTSTTEIVSLKVGNKRLKINISLQDSDDEFDEWFSESVHEKIGLRARTLWVHPMNQKRGTNGEFVTVCLPLREYPDRFFKYYRMSISTHDFILSYIEEHIEKHSFRPSVSPAERFAITIRYLSTGISFESLAESFLMDDYTVGKIVHEVCKVIYDKLSPKFMPIPSPEDFNMIAADFEQLWQFPNVIGAIDGKHIRIQRPKDSGSMYFNYKQFYSIVLQAVADAHCRFIFVDVGSYGKQSDGGIFAASSLSKFIDEKTNFPADPVVHLHGVNVKLPYLFVCDDAYPLKINMMKPFSGANLSKEQDIFNGRLSRARRCVECAFGILVNKWRVLLKSIETKKEGTIENIVKCTTVLHNIVITKEGTDSELMKAVQMKIAAREFQESLNMGRRYNHASNSAVVIRDCWVKYFNSPTGSVSWQSRYIKNST